MIDIDKIKEKCFGCAACLNICPVNAIKFIQNREGFYIPQIELEKCRMCDRCTDVCIIDNTVEQHNNPVVFAAKHFDKEVLLNSSSGGIFTALSDEILAEKGAVIAAIYDSQQKKVVHCVAETKEIRNLMRGSKYVQSDVQLCFKEAKARLEKGQKVLFVGTACQIHGLYNLLKPQNYSNLITCDVICHGTASPKILDNSVRFLEKKYGINIENIDFRNKKRGWKIPHPIVVAGNKEYDFKYYTKIYYKDVALRNCCYTCPYTKVSRISDVTIGDFWGVEKIMEEEDYSLGMSLVLANTPEGQKLLDKCKNNIWIQQYNMDVCMQKNLREPTSMPEKREKFWMDMENKDFDWMIRNYGEYGAKATIRVFLRKCKNKIVESFREKKWNKN